MKACVHICPNSEKYQTSTNIMARKHRQVYIFKKVQVQKEIPSHLTFCIRPFKRYTLSLLSACNQTGEAHTATAYRTGR